MSTPRFAVDAVVTTRTEDLKKGARDVGDLKEAVEGLRKSQAKAAEAEERRSAAQARQAKAAQAMLQAYQQEVAALLQLYKAARQGTEALQQLSQVQQIAAAVAHAGVSRESALGQSIAATVRLKIQLREEIEQLSASRARADRAASAVGSIRARTEALRQELAAAREGEEAMKTLAQARELRDALEDAGVQAGSLPAQEIEAEIALQARLREELREVAAARERDQRIQEEAQQYRQNVDREIASLRETSNQLQQLAGAHRRGTAAVREANVQQQIRNTLLRLGVQAGTADARAIELEIRAHDRLQREIGQTNSVRSSAGTGILSLRNAFLALQGVLAGIGIVEVVRSAVALVHEMERVERTLGVVLGTARAAQAELSFLRRESDRLGLSFKDASYGYSQFVAAAKGSLSLQEMRQVFTDVSEAMANLGAGGDQVQRVFVAMAQALSKGVLSMEEIRQQIGESLPQAVQLAAKALGKTDEEFNKLVSTGKILSKDVIPGMAREAVKAFGVAGGRIESALASLNRLNNALVDIRVEIGRGFMEGVLAGVSDLQGTLSSEELLVAARELGRQLGEALAVVIQGLTWLLEHLDELKAVLAALVISKVSKELLGLAQAGSETSKVLGFLTRDLGTLGGPKAMAVIAILAGVAGAMVYLTSKVDDGTPAINEFDRALMAHRDILLEVKATTIDLAAIQAELASQSHATLAHRASEVATQVNELREAIREAEEGRRSRLAEGYAPLADQAPRAIQARKTELQDLVNELKVVRFHTERAAEKANEFRANLKALQEAAKKGTGGLDDAQQKQLDQLVALVDAQRLELEEAERMYAARQKGTAAAREEADAIEAERIVREASAKADKLGADQKKNLLVVLGDLVVSMQQINQINIEYEGWWRRRIDMIRIDAEAHARLQDAMSGTREAMLEHTAQVWAEQEAERVNREGDKEYIALLKEQFHQLTRHVDAIDQEIRAIERKRQASQDLRQLEAQLLDLRNESTAAVTALAEVLEWENLLLEDGIRKGTPKADQLREEVRQRHAVRNAILGQIAAEERLQEARRNEASVRAELVDFRQQQEAIQRYGSELAGILETYGLLSDATKRLAIQEEILRAKQAERIDETTVDGFIRGLQIEAEIEGHHRLLDALREQAAATEILAHVQQPIRDAWEETGETIKDVLADVISGTEVEWEDLLDSMLKMWARAMIEMVQRWLAAQALMRSTQAGAGSVPMGSTQGYTGALMNMGYSAFTGGGAAGGGNLFGSGALGTSYANGNFLGGASSGAAMAGVFAAVMAVIMHQIKTSGRSQARSDIEISGAGLQVGSGSWNAQASSRNVAQTLAGVRGIIDIVQQFVKGIGAEFDGSSAFRGRVSVGKTGQGRKQNWWVEYGEGVVRDFGRDVEAAMEFGAVQAIKQSPLKGLDPIVARALKMSSAETVAALQEELTFAAEVANIGLSSIEVEIRNIGPRFDDLRDRISALLGPSEELIDALSRLSAAEASAWQSARDTITGRQRTAEEEYQDRLRQMKLFNAELALRKADIDGQIIQQETMLTRLKSGQIFNTALVLETEIFIESGRGVIRTLGGMAVAGGIAANSSQAAIDELIRLTENNLEALRAYRDALPDAIDPSEIRRGRRGRGGGGDDRRRRQEERESIRDEAERWRMSPITEAIADARARFDAFAESIKEAGFGAAESSRLMAEADRELQEELGKIRDEQKQKSFDFIGSGTAAGGPLMDGLEQLDATERELIDSNRDLWKAGLLTRREMADLNRAIQDSAVRQRDQLIGSAADSLFIDLYNLLGEEEAAAQLRYDLTLAELQLRREELELAMQTAGWTRERMDAILGPLGELIGRVIEGGPDTLRLGPGGSGGAGGGRGGTNWYEEQQRAREELDREREAALRRIEEIEGLRMSDLQREILDVQSEFRDLARVLGNTERVQKAYALAIEEAIRRHVEPLKQLEKDLFFRDESTVSGEEQYNRALSEFEELERRAAAGDLTAADDAEEVVRRLLEEAGQFLPTASDKYRELESDARELVARIIRMSEGAGGNLDLGDEGKPPEPLQINFGPVVRQLQDNHGEAVAAALGTKNEVNKAVKYLAKINENLTKAPPPLSKLR